MAVLAEEGTTGTDHAFVLYANQFCIFGVQQTTLELDYVLLLSNFYWTCSFLSF